MTISKVNVKINSSNTITFFYSQEAALCAPQLLFTSFVNFFFYSQEAAWCPLRPATHPPLSCASSARTGAGAFFGSFAAAHPLQWNAHHMCDAVRAEWVQVLCIPNSTNPYYYKASGERAKGSWFLSGNYNLTNQKCDQVLQMKEANLSTTKKWVGLVVEFYGNSFTIKFNM